MAVGALKSRDSPPCLLRFANNSGVPVRCFWVDYSGKEVPYGLCQPHCSFNQTTFEGHPWRLRNEASGGVLCEYVGPSATIVINADTTSSVLPGLHRVAQPPICHPQWGTYCQRGEALGIPVLAFDCVAQEAVDIAVQTICWMLADVEESVVARLVSLGGDVAVIGCLQETCCIPPHSHLRDVPAGNGGGTFNDATRGLGGHIGCPTTSVGEENLLMAPDDRYPSESILVHEFAHAVMELGLHEHPLRDAIVRCYQQAKASGAFDLSSYAMLNEAEYWAESTQAWFGATVRTDVTRGITTREQLKAADPPLAQVMAAVWGDGPWRYTTTAPRAFKPFRGGAPPPPPDLYRQQAAAASGGQGTAAVHLQPAMQHQYHQPGGHSSSSGGLVKALLRAVCCDFPPQR